MKCSKCKIEKLIDSFYKRKKDNSIVTPCKECMKLHSRQYKFKNKEKDLIVGRLYELKNQEKRKNYRFKNKDKISLKCKLWTKNNPDKHRERCRRRRAKVKNIKENYSKADEKFTRELFSNVCFNCHSNKKLCIDHHYPLDKGFPLTRDNAVLLCKSCNSSKDDKFPQNFYDSFKLYQLEYILAMGN